MRIGEWVGVVCIVLISYDSLTFVVMFSVPSCVNPLHPEPLSLVCATLGTNVFCQGKGG